MEPENLGIIANCQKTVEMTLLLAGLGHVAMTPSSANLVAVMTLKLTNTAGPRTPRSRFTSLVKP